MQSLELQVNVQLALPQEIHLLSLEDPPLPQSKAVSLLLVCGVLFLYTGLRVGIRTLVLELLKSQTRGVVSQPNT